MAISAVWPCNSPSRRIVPPRRVWRTALSRRLCSTRRRSEAGTSTAGNVVEQVDDADAIRVGRWLRGHDHVGDELPERDERLIGVEHACGDP